MSAHHKTSRAEPGRPSKAIEGIVPGSTDHRLLLALRGAGGMTSEQVCARFGSYQTSSLGRLRDAGLIDLPAIGQKGLGIHLTEKGIALSNPDGPLCRRGNLINYCQL